MQSNKQALLLILVFLFVNLHSFSQVSDSLFELSCQDEDIIILDETKKVNFIGEKLYLMSVNINSSITLVVKTEKGLLDFQPLKLPKKFDELYIHHAPAIRNTDWNYDNIHIQEFSAYQALKDGKQIQIPIRKNVSNKRVLNNEGFFGFTNIFEYYFDDLKIGDTVVLTYNYDIAFTENWLRLLSNRTFFHGKYPKKKYHLEWCYNINLEVDSIFVNHDIPEVFIEKKQLCYSWTFNNLPGCLDEPASRPYETLPHFIFVPKPYDLQYTQYDSYKYEFIPIYFYEANLKQKELYREYWDNTIGNKNKNNLFYQKTANKILAKTHDDTIGTLKLRYLQQYMVDSVKYYNAFKYYNHEEDHRRQRAGVDLYGYRVNDNNLERVYGNMIQKLGFDFYTAYPVDSRAGIITPQYNSTIIDNDLLFTAVLNNNNLILIIPKSDKNNYYLEEVPFYYEGIPVLLLHYTDYANPSINDGAGKRNFNTKFRKWQTPLSGFKDNYRKIQSKAIIAIEENLVDFKTRVILSGQYSTVTRFVYFEKPVDSTINLKYHEPIWNINNKVQVKNVKPQHPLIYYPYKTSIITEYEAKDLLTIEDDLCRLKPGNWFKLVYNSDIRNETRFLDYYADFIGSDSYSYLLEFDKAIQLKSNQDTTEISNSYAHFCFLAQQIDESKVLLTCNYNIKSHKVEKELIHLVTEINDAIVTLNEVEIIVEIAE